MLAQKRKQKASNLFTKIELESEEWREVRGYEKLYQVSSLGRIKSVDRKVEFIRKSKIILTSVREKILQPLPDKGNQGHCFVSLSKGNKIIRKSIHRIVLEAFVGPCPEGMECRHLDGIPWNNRLTNLCWGTKKENMADRTKHGNTQIGIKHHNVKLTEADVHSIRRLYGKDGHSYARLSVLFKVSAHQIWLIVKRKNWVHI